MPNYQNLEIDATLFPELGICRFEEQERVKDAADRIFSACSKEAKGGAAVGATTGFIYGLYVEGFGSVPGAVIGAFVGYATAGGDYLRRPEHRQILKAWLKTQLLCR